MESSEYIRAYDSVFDTQSDGHGLDGMRLWLPIDVLAEQDADDAVSICRRELKRNGMEKDVLLGSCFSAVKIASLVLCDRGVRHTVTVGNVVVNSCSWYETTPQSIERDLEEGFVLGEPAVAHSWITLENGRILDFTLLYSMANRWKRKPPKLINGIYTCGNVRPQKIVHVPMFLGPMYYAKVVVMPNARGFSECHDWICRIVEMLGATQSK